MLTPLSWLKDYVDIDVTPKEPRPARGSTSRGRWNGWGCSGISPGFSLRQRSASASMSRQFTCWPPRPCTPRRQKRSSLRTVSTP